MSNPEKMAKRRQNQEIENPSLPQEMIEIENPSLPQELILDIFSRMPQKSIGKCKCLSKTWLSLVSTTDFLKLCFNHQANLILINPTDHSLHLLLSSPLVDNEAVSRKLDFPGSWTEVVGSCNGLALLTNKEGELFLLNPFTDKISKVPDLDLYKRKWTYGFGYDASSNDYKIVTLSYYPEEFLPKTYFDVFSVKTGVWKHGGGLPFRWKCFPCDPLVSGVFVNGVLHWQIKSRLSTLSVCIVLMFDLAKEVFHDMHLTGSDSESPGFVGMSLVDRGGRLCMVSSDDNIFRSVEVWTMEEYWSVESWRETTICENYGKLCFLGQEVVFLRARDGRVCVYDVKKKSMKEFVVDGVPAGCVYVGNFVDSLA